MAAAQGVVVSLSEQGTIDLLPSWCQRSGYCKRFRRFCRARFVLGNSSLQLPPRYYRTSSAVRATLTGLSLTSL